MALYKYLYYYYFLTPVLNSQGMKKLRYAIHKKYKNQAGMNLLHKSHAAMIIIITTPMFMVLSS